MISTLKNASLLLVLFLFTGCGEKFYHFDKEDSGFNNKSPFNIKSVNVALHNYDTKKTDKKITYYASDKELAKILKNDLIEKIKNKNRLCNSIDNCFDITIDLNYNRLFAMASNDIIYPRFSYFVKVSNNNSSIFKYHKINQIIDSGITGDFSSIGKIGSKKINKQEETNNIKLISLEIVDLLLNAKK